MSERLQVTDTTISGLRVVQVSRFGDARGFLERLFSSADLAAVLAGRMIAQVNHSFTLRSGTVRGLHFQHPPHGEMKFVHCLRGEAFDVAVDLRNNSPTFLKWHAEVLSPTNPRIMVIPEGFAHGLQTLTDDCEMLYLHTAAYHPGAEGGLSARDPMLAIAWPREIRDLSPRDASHTMLSTGYRGLVL
jgi:dTDP-4-dehydrorhamnose 3,5-epimerase